MIADTEAAYLERIRALFGNRLKRVDRRDLLVCQVAFTLNSREGEVTRLTLAPRDGFIVPAEPDSSGTGGEGGGVDAWILQQMKKQGIKFDDE